MSNRTPVCMPDKMPNRTPLCDGVLAARWITSFLGCFRAHNFGGSIHRLQWSSKPCGADFLPKHLAADKKTPNRCNSLTLSVISQQVQPFWVIGCHQPGQNPKDLCLLRLALGSPTAAGDVGDGTSVGTCPTTESAERDRVRFDELLYKLVGIPTHNKPTNMNIMNGFWHWTCGKILMNITELNKLMMIFWHWTW